LEDYGVPTTFYITTGFIDSNSPSWIDTIEAAVEQSAVVDLKVPFHRLNGSYETSQQKVELLDQIRALVKSNPSLDPYEFANDFVNKLELKSPRHDPDLDEKMNWDQVRELGRNSLFTIGGHGHTHRILEYLNDAELRGEISMSLERLSVNLCTPAQHYSYPEGLTNCFSDRVVRVLREHGVLCAPTAEPGINHIGDDLFRLKRIAVI
jgi:peptidoglycan/xylan/chitin deacetylase (PgdA/CDA1 family)